MRNSRQPKFDIEEALQDLADYERFFAGAELESRDVGLEELEMLSAAGNYAAFLDKFGLADDDAARP